MWGPYAELVAFGVGEGGPPHVERVLVVDVGRAERRDSCDFGGDVVGLKVEVNPILYCLGLRHLDEHVSDLRQVAKADRREEGRWRDRLGVDRPAEHGRPELADDCGIGAVECDGFVGELHASSSGSDGRAAGGKRYRPGHPRALSLAVSRSLALTTLHPTSTRRRAGIVEGCGVGHVVDVRRTDILQPVGGDRARYPDRIPSREDHRRYNPVVTPTRLEKR